MSALEGLAAPGATRHDWVIDAGLALGLTLATVAPYAAFIIAFQGSGVTSTAIAFATGLLMTGSLLLRRHYPLVMLAIATVASVLQIALVNRPVASIVVLPLVIYSVARWVPGRLARIVVLLGWAGSIAAPIRWFLANSEPTPATLIAALLVALVCMGLVLTPYATGRRLRDAAKARQAQTETEAERYRLLLAEREREAEAAEVRLRNQIARELHDIVAHSLSVMIVQAEGGKAQAAKRPEAAAEVLGTLAATGREALGETRRILALLRRESGEAELAPQPGLAELGDMVRRAGASLTQVGTPPLVSPAVGLTAYRVAQEALTNVLKHAGPGAQARVTVTYSEGHVTVEVTDDGKGAKGRIGGRGYGLRGMAERVGAMGGTLEAGPRDGGGFVVRAELPVSPPSPPDPVAAAATTGGTR